MTIRAFVQTAGKSVVRRIAVVLVLVVLLSGCDRAAALSVVKAVAAGVPSLAPFFGENSGLGRDTAIRSQPARGGGLQQGDTPGLYGGTREPTICDIDKLKGFLTDPVNHRKAQVWADVLGITTDGIPDHLDRLTPVLLRHDTLVRNHDYKKEEAVPFNSLLQAGIAILVDEQGLPAVKCSCGNPLRPFEGDMSRISVRFEDGNEKWSGYDRESAVAVRPASRTLEKIALVDVQDADRGIERPVGTSGEDDTSFDTRERRPVPDLAGTTFRQAGRLLADQGLAVAYDGEGLPPDSATVTASDPVAGTELRFGAYVTLSVAEGGGQSGGVTNGAATTGPASPGTTPPGAGSSPPAEPSAPTPPTTPGQSPSTSAPPPPSSSGASSPGGGESSSGPPSPNPPSSSAPPRTTSAPPVTSSPPEVTSAPPVTSSAPVTSAPVTTDPATGEPGATATAAGKRS